MIRVHKDSVVPKYTTGKWTWNDQTEEYNYSSWEGKTFEHEKYVQSSSGYKFKKSINQIEEVIFRQEFARNTDSLDDGNIIRLEDIKRIVLFLAPSEFMSNRFITLIHHKIIDKFLNALIIYFEYFLRLVEFILIRRDEIAGETQAQIESKESDQIKRIFSENLSQYRLILAREYSVIVMGSGEMEPFYHFNLLVKISATHKDRVLHEMLLAFATQVVWITHHRRAYEIIDEEMNRLFRSEHFKLNRKDSIEFSPVEQELLYGLNYKRANYRRQNSPLIQEISNVSKANLPILWIGEKKYRGNDLRMQQLELELVVPDGNLCLIDVKHGILGDVKCVFNTLLSIDIQALREHGHSLKYDPYWMVRQPYLEIPKLDKIDQEYERLESYFYIKDNRFRYEKSVINKWKRRDKVIEYIKSGGLVIDVFESCRNELDKTKLVDLNIDGITQAFMNRKMYLRKQ